MHIPGLLGSLKLGIQQLLRRIRIRGSRLQLPPEEFDLRIQLIDLGGMLGGEVLNVMDHVLPMETVKS